MRTYGYMHKDNHNAGIRELESANEFEMSDGERDAYGLRADLWRNQMCTYATTINRQERIAGYRVKALIDRQDDCVLATCHTGICVVHVCVYMYVSDHDGRYPNNYNQSFHLKNALGAATNTEFIYNGVVLAMRFTCPTPNTSSPSEQTHVAASRGKHDGWYKTIGLTLCARAYVKTEAWDKQGVELCGWCKRASTYIRAQLRNSIAGDTHIHTYKHTQAKMNLRTAVGGFQIQVNRVQWWPRARK